MWLQFVFFPKKQDGMSILTVNFHKIQIVIQHLIVNNTNVVLAASMFISFLSLYTTF